ncbi:hypothetical protein DPMN_059394 [Dreissena polymorpha]|uniref:Uncharacterized protein n=1 Tax=Dreissena polymorpha TaxID=45954 RepID=A0A9D4C415_DREPO|nr:hypothetical protein DPMN_059394 [Dreissena polymorpha]
MRPSYIYISAVKKSLSLAQWLEYALITKAGSIRASGVPSGAEERKNGVPTCFNGRSHERINGACLSHRLPARGLPRVRRKPLFLLFLPDSTLGALPVTFSGLLLVLVKWTDPGGTAIPGQPVTRAEQAPDISSVSKNQFNIEVPQWGTYQILS